MPADGMAPADPEPGISQAAKRRRRAAESDIRTLARTHANAAVSALAAVMADAKATPAARVSAASALLDRGYGKPPPALTGEGGEGPVCVIVRTGIDRSGA